MVTVSLPRLLEPAVGVARRRIDVEGRTLGDAIEGLLARAPELRVHLFDESRALRPHVLCFVDGESTRLEDLGRELSPDADITFLQAVSGG